MAADEPPKHKPSETHTLDDVLKSLQDLIRNDLLDDGKVPAPPRPPADPAIPRKRGRPRKEAAESAEVTGDADEKETEDLDKTLDSLEDLVEAEIDLSAQAPVEEIEIEAELAPEKAPPPHPLSLDEPQEQSDEPPAPESNQQEFPLDLPPTVEAAPATAHVAPVEKLPQPEPEVGHAPPPQEITAAPVDELAPDDIPVLDDVVAHADVATPAMEEKPAGLEPTAVRALAIRIVARLNIERRQHGEPLLEAATVDRLEKILTEELARHALLKQPDPS